ncbi:MAG: hypothetical protein V8T45_11200 [Oscillospiraceae bacterium]
MQGTLISAIAAGGTGVGEVIGAGTYDVFNAGGAAAQDGGV